MTGFLIVKVPVDQSPSPDCVKALTRQKMVTPPGRLTTGVKVEEVLKTMNIKLEKSLDVDASIR